jgi:hypothetical protein
MYPKPYARQGDFASPRSGDFAWSVKDDDVLDG